MLLAAAALAATMEVHVGDVDATAVAAVVRDSTAVRIAACAAPAGRWVCEPVEVTGESAQVFLLVDGRLVDAGTMPAGTVAVALGAGRVVASADPAGLPAGPSRPAVPTVIARVGGHGGAPVIAMGRMQLSCHDDGSFPDRTMNDGEPGCAGPGLESGEVVLQSAEGERVPLGSVTWPEGPVRWLTIDGSTVSVAPFDLPLPQPPAPVEVAAVDRAGAAPGASGGAPSAGTAPAAGGGAPVPTNAVSRPGGGVGVWVLGVVAVAGAVVLVRLGERRRAGVRRSLRPAPAVPLLPGGPGWGESAVLVTADVPALVEELVRRLAPKRRVIVAGADVPATEGGVWIATVPTWEEVAACAKDLAASPGLPVAVLVGPGLTDPGAVAPDPVGQLARKLPPGVWLGAVAGPDERVGEFLPAWTVTGPPWAATRGRTP